MFLYFLSETFTNNFYVAVLDILSASAVLFAILVIISKNPISSVLYLIGLFVVIAGYLCTLGLTYIGLAYLLVYVGAVSILFLFILMLINIRISELLSETRNSIPLVVFVSTILGIILGSALNFDNLFRYLNNLKTLCASQWDSNLGANSHITSIGNILYTNYSMWLIETSLILLLAMVGAIVITLRSKAVKENTNLHITPLRNEPGLALAVLTICLCLSSECLIRLHIPSYSIEPFFWDAVNGIGNFISSDKFIADCTDLMFKHILDTVFASKDTIVDNSVNLPSLDVLKETLNLRGSNLLNNCAYLSTIQNINPSQFHDIIVNPIVFLTDGRAAIGNGCNAGITDSIWFNYGLLMDYIHNRLPGGQLNGVWLDGWGVVLDDVNFNNLYARLGAYLNVLTHALSNLSDANNYADIAQWNAVLTAHGESINHIRVALANYPIVLEIIERFADLLNAEPLRSSLLLDIPHGGNILIDGPLWRNLFADSQGCTYTAADLGRSFPIIVGYLREFLDLVFLDRYLHLEPALDALQEIDNQAALQGILAGLDTAFADSVAASWDAYQIGAIDLDRYFNELQIYQDTLETAADRMIDSFARARVQYAQTLAGFHATVQGLQTEFGHLMRRYIP